MFKFQRSGIGCAKTQRFPGFTGSRAGWSGFWFAGGLLGGQAFGWMV
jgi:hypothetical protein